MINAIPIYDGPKSEVELLTSNSSSKTIPKLCLPAAKNWPHLLIELTMEPRSLHEALQMHTVHCCVFTEYSYNLYVHVYSARQVLLSCSGHCRSRSARKYNREASWNPVHNRCTVNCSSVRNVSLRISTLYSCSCTHRANCVRNATSLVPRPFSLLPFKWAWVAM